MMSKVEDSVEALSQIVGTIVRQTLGPEADFIFIPFIAKENGSDAAVISSVKGDELCFHLGMITAKTIERFEEHHKNCPDCNPKKSEKKGKKDNVVKIH